MTTPYTLRRDTCRGVLTVRARVPPRRYVCQFPAARPDLAAAALAILNSPDPAAALDAAARALASALRLENPQTAPPRRLTLSAEAARRRVSRQTLYARAKRLNMDVHTYLQTHPHT